MRRFTALARSAALEALAEPLSAILFFAALVAVHILPLFHLHQFGEAGRLSRECGFSALLVFGLVFATSSSVHSIGRELESGTAAAALARPVPRALFFCAKMTGVLAAFALFLVAVSCATLLSVKSSQMGAVVAHGEMRAWGPGFLAGVGGTVFAFALAALSNAFLRTRFCVGACLMTAIAQPTALASVFFANQVPVQWNILPAMSVLALGCSVFVVMAGALAVCLKPAAVASVLTVAVALSFISPLRAVMPDINRFWFVDALARGGTLPAGDLRAAVAAAVLLLAFWLVAGSALLTRREIP